MTYPITLSILFLLSSFSCYVHGQFERPNPAAYPNEDIDYWKYCYDEQDRQQLIKETEHGPFCLGGMWVAEDQSNFGVDSRCMKERNCHLLVVGRNMSKEKIDLVVYAPHFNNPSDPNHVEDGGDYQISEVLIWITREKLPASFPLFNSREQLANPQIRGSMAKYAFMRAGPEHPIGFEERVTGSVEYIDNVDGIISPVIQGDSSSNEHRPIFDKRRSRIFNRKTGKHKMSIPYDLTSVYTWILPRQLNYRAPGESIDLITMDQDEVYVTIACRHYAFKYLPNKTETGVVKNVFSFKTVFTPINVETGKKVYFFDKRHSPHDSAMTPSGSTLSKTTRKGKGNQTFIIFASVIIALSVIALIAAAVILCKSGEKKEEDIGYFPVDIGLTKRSSMTTRQFEFEYTEDDLANF